MNTLLYSVSGIKSIGGGRRVSAELIRAFAKFTLPFNSTATRIGKDEFLMHLENDFAAVRADTFFAREFKII